MKRYGGLALVALLMLSALRAQATNSISAGQCLLIAGGGVGLLGLSSLAWWSGAVSVWAYTVYAIPADVFKDKGVNFKTVSSAIAAHNFKEIKTSYLGKHEGETLLMGDSLHKIEKGEGWLAWNTRIAGWDVEEKEIKLKTNLSGRSYYKVKILHWLTPLPFSSFFSPTLFLDSIVAPVAAWFLMSVGLGGFIEKKGF